MNIRVLEKSSKNGFMFYISYNGKKFNCFDEMEGKISVKGEFRKIMHSLGFTWAKGIQQAGRTDAKVSAKENILYVSSNYSGDIYKLIEEFNKNSGNKLKINRVEKTIAGLVFPDMIEGRQYLYNYPIQKIKRDKQEIEGLCTKLSGKYDVSEFTDTKGKMLQEHIREVEVKFTDEGLRFRGNSFMPKQVRIMSGYIFTGEKTALPGEYLTLEKIILTPKMKELIITEETEMCKEGVLKIEKIGNGTTYIFYIPKGKKGEFIGKNGKNIKGLRKKYGEIIVREL